MARTILDEVLGFRPDFIEHQLAHAVRDPNGRAYNRTAFLPERRVMMQTWADYLDGLRAGEIEPRGLATHRGLPAAQRHVGWATTDDLRTRERLGRYILGPRGLLIDEPRPGPASRLCFDAGRTRPSRGGAPVPPERVAGRTGNGWPRFTVSWRSREQKVTLLNMGPDDQLLHFGRVVPAGSDENAVYMRSLRPGEEDTGEGVHVPAGKRLVIRAGDLSFSSDEIDARSPKGRGGYAPVADTIWTWYRMVGAEDQGLLMLLLAAARRLDATHVFWSATMDALDESCTVAGIERRATLFRALAMAEVTVISLSRAVEMLYRLEREFCLGLRIPEKIDSSRATVRRMRHALEHIDDRAMGKARDDTADSAMSIFIQPHFVDQGVLTYAGEGMAFTTGLPVALGHCREVLMSIIDLRPRCQVSRPTSTNG